MERQISRSQLQSPQDTPPSSPDPEDIVRLRQHDIFEFVSHNHTDTRAIGTGNGPINDIEEDQLEFQLFAATKFKDATNQTTTVQKIKLRSPTPTNNNPGFINPKRPIRYYITPPLSSAQREDFTAASLTGAQVLANSHSPWPGSAYPWKVLSLPISSLSSALRAQHSSTLARLTGGDSEPAKRKRKGKKARIKVRMRAAAAARRVEEGKQAEELEREKRTRRNREKKVKRKMKEKGKKAEGGK